MALAPGMEAKFNTSTAEYFTTRNEYQRAVFLTIYWTDHDLNDDDAGASTDKLGDEIKAWQEFFNGTLKFELETCKLPSSGFKTALTERLETILGSLEHESEYLFVVYYAGHNGINATGFAELSARKTGGPSLPWAFIHPHIDETRGDVLLILDCCHAAKVVHQRLNKSKGRGYLLGACSATTETPYPGPKSFSTLLLEHMRRIYLDSQHIDMSDLCREISSSSRFKDTPAYLPLAHDNRHIVLRKQQKQRSLKRRTIDYMQMTVHISGNISPLELEIWLKSNVPKHVSGLKIDTALTEAMRVQAVLHDRRLTKLLETLPQSTCDGIIERKEALQSATDRIFRIMQHTSTDAAIEDALSHVESTTADLNDAVECPTLLGMTQEDLEVVSDDLRNCHPGLFAAIMLRLAILKHEAARSTMELTIEGIWYDKPLEKAHISAGKRFVLGRRDNRRVLIEYIVRTNNDTGRVEAIERVATLLSMNKPSTTRTLDCMGYICDHALDAYGLIHELPPELQGSQPTILSLGTAVEKIKYVPLDTRCRVAHTLVLAVEALHRLGWLHKGLNAEDIVVFSTSSDLKELSVINQPWLFGFEQSRLDEQHSRLEEDVRSNYACYCHPERRGHPVRPFRKADDIYSLGLLLIEIAFWSRLSRLATNGKQQVGIDPANSIRCLYPVHKLSFMVGESYASAVNACFTFHEDTRRMTESEQQRHMQAHIRDKVKATHGYA